jgi:hypothetical protein
MEERKKVVPERPSINPIGGLFDSVENIRRPSEMNKMREMIFLGSARNTDIDLDNVRVLLGGNEKIDPEIHKLKTPSELRARNSEGDDQSTHLLWQPSGLC